jgi:SHS family sialic acid transporter-like MFS transporter
MPHVTPRQKPKPHQLPVAASEGIGKGAWMALTAALLGWMFDGAEMGVFSMVGTSAVADLLNLEVKDPLVRSWFSIIIAIFLVGAATGGVLFGWLGDRIGRVRAMSLSVVTYAVFTGLCGFARTPEQLGILRFIASLGMGGEWSLGVALVMEVWPNRSRAFMAGLIGAAANVGYMVVGFVGLGLNAVIGELSSALSGIGLSDENVAILTDHQGWRIIMMLGALPALLTFLIRLFVPESEKWQKEQKSGSTSNWATQDLLGVLIGSAGCGLIVWLWAPSDPNNKTPLVIPTAVVMIGTAIGLVTVIAGYAYPVVRFLQRVHLSSGRERDAWRPTFGRMMLAACLSGVALLGTWGTTQQAAAWANELSGGTGNAREWTLIWLSVGAVLGTIVAAMMGDWFGRRPTYFLLCVVSMVSVWCLYLGVKSYGPGLLGMAFVIGATTASFYGWLPLYLPELFRTQVRATGQGFGFNFGRIIAAIGVLQMSTLLGKFKEPWQIGSLEVPKGFPSVCLVMSLVYVIGMVMIWFGPETKGKPLPE